MLDIFFVDSSFIFKEGVCRSFKCMRPPDYITGDCNLKYAAPLYSCKSRFAMLLLHPVDGKTVGDDGKTVHSPLHIKFVKNF